MKFYQIVKLKNVLLGINFLAVLFNASLYLFISRYINENQLDYQLLTRLNSIPTSPMVIFSRSLILFFILAIIIFRQNVDLTKIKNNLIFLLELVLALAIFFSLNMAYNGIFLLVFINLFLNNKDKAEFNKYRLWLSTGFILLILFSISDQNLINEMIKAPSLSSYITFLPQSTGSILSFIRNLLSLTNLMLFIIILVLYAHYSITREQELKNKLAISEEFKLMADLTEHISHDKDRERLARDIHDTIGHTLTGFAVGLDAAIVLIDVNPTAAKKQLGKVSASVKEGLLNIRESLNRIRPGALDNYTFKAALEGLLNKFESISHLQIDLEYNWNAEKLAKTTEDVIFHIIEETFTNSLKHGHATKVMIMCSMKDNYYQLIIHNNGLSTPDFKPGFGLNYLKDLVSSLGGQIKFNGKDGFTTIVMIPKEVNNND
ncbi:Sensor histidine kinase LiaS [Lactobacillus helveticus]|nr:histidine kinase [Lactobacillus helveticus]NRN80151.1 Sensor histidine kinase LiaS [Lactobacillus helveticus]NRN84559.1 Sensor histidine kinase LiaS [Lactobacillus helveticus]NRN99347.1 Sensor histidine kinase LiaS [Lactobacillus helveticus]NRO23684.1 Sensor histidine kinase LiaS [Lactobacillus helveticus]NRO43940.1 Sensor histidine kinase LiaS [Lactobacillus helveticus]